MHRRWSIDDGKPWVRGLGGKTSWRRSLAPTALPCVESRRRRLGAGSLRRPVQSSGVSLATTKVARVWFDEANPKVVPTCSSGVRRNESVKLTPTATLGSHGDDDTRRRRWAQGRGGRRQREQPGRATYGCSALNRHANRSSLARMPRNPRQRRRVVVAMDTAGEMDLTRAGLVVMGRAHGLSPKG
jgi:hypothetical protein